MKTTLNGLIAGVFGLLLAFAAAAQDAPVAGTARQDATITAKRMAMTVDIAENGESVVTTTMELVPENDAAVAYVGHTALSYRESADELTIVEAYTLKRDGRRLGVNTSAIFPQSPQGAANAPIFDDMRQKAIVFPNVEAGDTVAYTWRIHTKTPFFPGAYWSDVFAPRSAAFADVEVTVTTPRTRPLTTDAVGADVETAKLGNKLRYTWRYANPQPDPTYRPEMVYSITDVPHFSFSTFKSYDEIAHAYAAVSLPKAAVTRKIRAQAEEITKGASDRREQARLLHEWVSRRIRYVSVGLGIGTIIPHDAGTTLDNGYGDCKDKAVLLTALLAAKGITSELVIINASSVYELPRAPSPGAFNHVINWLPEFGVYTDTTSSVNPFGVLAFEEFSKPVLHVVKSGPAQRTTPVLKPGEAVSVHEAEMHQDSTGRFGGRSDTTATGAFTIPLRFAAMGIEAAGQRRTVQSMLGAKGAGSFELDPLLPLTSSYRIRGRFEYEFERPAPAGDTFFIPHGYRFLSRAADSMIGPLMQARELSGLEVTPCRAGTQIEKFSLTPAPGMEVRTLPEPFTLANDSFSYRSHWTREGRKVTLHREFKSMTQGPLCTGALRRAAAGALIAISRDRGDADIAVHPIKDYDKLPEAMRAEVAFYTKATLEDPANPVLRANLAAAHRAVGDDAAAVAAYGEALKLNSAYWGARLERGMTYWLWSKKEPAKAELALADLDEAVRMRRNEPYAYVMRASVHEQMKNTAAAITDLSSAIDLDPRNARHYVSRARIQCAASAASLREGTRLQGCAKAITDLDRALELSPKNATAYVMRAMIHVQAGDKDKARKDLDAADALKSTDPEFLGMRAVVLAAGGFEGSAEAASALVEKRPGDVRALLLKASLAASKRRFAEAEKDARAVLAIDSANIDAQEILARLFLEQRKYAEAVSQFDIVLSRDPSRTRSFEQRGTAHYALKNYGKALADYERVRELLPSHPEITELISDAQKGLKNAKSGA